MLHHDFLHSPYSSGEKEVSQATVAASTHIAQLVALYGEHADALWKEPAYDEMNSFSKQFFSFIYLFIYFVSFFDSSFSFDRVFKWLQQTTLNVLKLVIAKGAIIPCDRFSLVDAVVDETRNAVLSFYENTTHCAQDCTNRHILLFGTISVFFEISELICKVDHIFSHFLEYPQSLQLLNSQVRSEGFSIYDRQDDATEAKKEKRMPNEQEIEIKICCR